VLFALYYIVKNFEDNFNAIHDIRKEFSNMTFSYMEQELQSIVYKCYNSMAENVSKVVKSCPNNNANCDYPAVEIYQQKMIYKCIMKDIFMLDVRNKVKGYILENGYHDFSEAQFEKYIHKKGAYLYNYIVDELKDKCGNSIPDLMPRIGENFSKGEAIKKYRAIISNALENERLRDEKIKKYKRTHGLASKFPIIGRVVKGLMKEEEVV